MLALPTVTLCCVDTVNPALAIRALQISQREIRFSCTLLLTDREIDAHGIEVRQIQHLGSKSEYSAFILKRLAAHIETEHVLLVQWDGWVTHPAAWRSEFLSCDYIGAKWFRQQDSLRVGNGGFSLRSRKLLVALQDPRIASEANEDETIGRTYRPLLEREYGIVFSSTFLADAFSSDPYYPIGRPFGFHGLYNFPRIMGEQELLRSIPRFSPAAVASPQMAYLGRNCVELGWTQAAQAIYQRIHGRIPLSLTQAKWTLTLAPHGTSRQL